MSAPATVGWCPGALRPMASGDGLIVRVKPRGGRLTLEQADAVAALAARDGNGRLDLTSRANLQIRGVTPASHDRLVADLRAVDLLDRSAAAEAVRNVVASPLAGLDPSRPDAWPVLRALERRLAEDEGLRALPAKWSVVLDDGGPSSLAAVAADVRFTLGPGGTARLQLDGLADEALLPVAAMPDLVSRLGRLACAGPEPLRMRPLAARLGAGVLERLGLGRAPTAAPPRPALSARDLLGSRRGVLGFAPAFGGVAAADLRAALALLAAAGARELRLTPWRTVLAPGVGPGIAGGLRDLGFVLDADDPRLSVSACVGAPACHRATTPTRTHAAALAAMHPSGTVHVAGCVKACGQPGTTRWTLVGQGGRYDVVAGGSAREPAVARGLSFPEAAAWITRAGQARTD